jgi:predicted RNase H-like HicB family nuclease
VHYRLAVEDIEPDHWVAWVLDLPACFSQAKIFSEAVADAPRRIAEYFSWVREHDPRLPLPPGSVETDVAETFHSLPSQEDPEYIVNAFFEDDRRPLSYWDIIASLRLFDWTRQDFRKVIATVDERRKQNSISTELLESISKIINHIAGAENWYLGQMGLALKRTAQPDDPLRNVELIRKNTEEQIWNLLGEAQITEARNEKWSGRKVIRRALWHERDHTQHIQQLLEVA